jgi:hypothetical protein
VLALAYSAQSHAIGVVINFPIEVHDFSILSGEEMLVVFFLCLQRKMVSLVPHMPFFELSSPRSDVAVNLVRHSSRSFLPLDN